MAVAVAVAATALAVATPAAEQTLSPRKPGLWETETTMAGTSQPDMQDRLANMPPEKRAQMEAYMRQRGISVGPAGTTMTTRFCLTPQDAAEQSGRTLLRNLERDSRDCEQKSFDRGANEVRFRLACRDANGDLREMDGRIHDIGPEHYAAEWHATSAKGEMRISQRARWLGSDCSAQ